jgi:hypothetical protein
MPSNSFEMTLDEISEKNISLVGGKAAKLDELVQKGFRIPDAFEIEDGRLGIGGFLFKDGENIPLMEMHLKEHELDEDGVYPSKTVLELVDARGEKHVLIGDPGNIIPIPSEDAEGNKSILIQTFGSFELNDEKGGYGSYEALRRMSK